jgi:hypothetical protein
MAIAKDTMSATADMHQKCSTFLSVIIIIALMCTIYGFFILNTVSHEAAHKQIYLYFGCKEPVVHINYLTIQGTATCMDIDHTWNEKEESLHAWNEIISYNSDVVLGAMFAILVLYFCIKQI